MIQTLFFRAQFHALVLFYCLLPIVTQAQLPRDELVLYMSFDDPQSNEVIDGSTSRNDGTIMEASIAKGKGKYGDAMEFKGRDNYVLIRNSESLSMADEVTIAAWVNWNDAPGDGWLCIMANGTQGGPWENYGLFVNRGNRYFYFTLSAGGKGAHRVMNSGHNTTEPGKWTHCACTYDGNSAKIYIDGNLVNTVPHGAELTAGDQDLRLGHRDGSNHWYNGYLDEVVVFSVALDADQVKELKNNIVDVKVSGKLTTVWAKVKSRT